MKPNISRIASIILIVSVLLCLGTMALIQLGVDQKKAGTNELLTSHIMLERTFHLLESLQDAEKGQRRYLLTGNEECLDSYKKALIQINHEIQALVELTVLSPGLQGLLVNSLIPRINQRKEKLNEGIYIYEQSGMDRAVEYLISDRDSSLMDSIRVDFERMRELEMGMLQDKSQAIGEAYVRYHYFAYGGLIFIGLSIVFGIYLIRDYDGQKSILIERMSKTNTELARLNKQEVTLREEKNRFLGIAAHDLRSPLNAIISVADILKMESGTYQKEHLEYVDYILESANQMNTLINNLLDVHRTEEHNNTAKPEVVNIKNLLKALLFKYENRAKQKDLSISLEYELSTDTVITDKSIFSQVVDNLVSNAVKFSPKGKNVIVRLRNVENGFVLEVEDEGPGIKDSEKQKLFRKYQTLSARPTAGEQSIGLGLSIVYDQMKLVGGEIDCESKEGEGARFIATFPDNFHHSAG